MARRKRLKPAAIARRVLLFVAGSLFAGFLAVFLNAVLNDFIPRHFAVSIAVGVSVATTLALLRLLKHPPLLLAKVHPLAAGFCAGLGVHIARLWIR